MDQIGRYKIIGELGKGAMGVVYKAQDPAIGRLIAVKSIRLDTLADDSERDRMRERLFREAQSAGILSHPGIVTIYDIAEENGMAFIFMELVNGPPMEKMLKAEQTPDKGTLISVFRQTAAALDYAHKKGIVHRDIKPANIMIHEDGSAKITDFGIAKIVSQQMTQAGTLMGTPSYMSPEQVQGGVISGRTDQFSLAVITYEVLTGEKPFAAEYLPTLLFKIVREDPVAPHRLNPTLTPLVEAVMRKALAKNPLERYETCVEFVDALAAACNASDHWVPMPRGALHNMPTSGSQESLASMAETVIAPNETVGEAAVSAASMAETVMLPTNPGVSKTAPAQSEASKPEAPQAKPAAAEMAETALATPTQTGKSKTEAPGKVETGTKSGAEPGTPPVEVPEGLKESAPGMEKRGQNEKRGQKVEDERGKRPTNAAGAPGIEAAPVVNRLPEPQRVPHRAEQGPSKGNIRKIAAAIGAVVVIAGLIFFLNRKPEQGTAAGDAGSQTATAAGSASPASAPGSSQATAGTQASPPGQGTQPGAAIAGSATAAAPPKPAAPPAPTETTVELTVTPGGSEATFDGNAETHCVSPCSLNLPNGRHTLLIHKDGYRDAQRVFTLPAEADQNITLEASSGTLSVVTNPAGLTVTIDGQEQAHKSPVNVALPPGPHRVQVTKGSDKQEFTVDVRDGVLTQRNVEWGQ